MAFSVRQSQTLKAYCCLRGLPEASFASKNEVTSDFCLAPFYYFILYVLYYLVEISFLLVLLTHLNYDINDFIFREVFQCLKKLKRALTGLA